MSKKTNGTKSQNRKIEMNKELRNFYSFPPPPPRQQCLRRKQTIENFWMQHSIVNLAAFAKTFLFFFLSPISVSNPLNRINFRTLQVFNFDLKFLINVFYCRNSGYNVCSIFRVQSNINSVSSTVSLSI